MRGTGLAVVALAALVAQAPAVNISVDARSLQPGELVVLTITAPPAPAGAAHVRAFDRDWPAYPTDERTWRVLLGIDLDTTPGAYDVSARIDAPSGTYRGSKTLTVLPKVFPTRRLTVDEDFVNPPAAVQPRIEREAAELARLWATSSSVPAVERPLRATRGRGGQQCIRHPQRVQRPGEKPSWRRGLPEPGGHGGESAGRRPRSSRA